MSLEPKPEKYSLRKSRAPVGDWKQFASSNLENISTSNRLPSSTSIQQHLHTKSSSVNHNSNNSASDNNRAQTAVKDEKITKLVQRRLSMKYQVNDYNFNDIVKQQNNIIKNNNLSNDPNILIDSGIPALPSNSNQLISINKTRQNALQSNTTHHKQSSSLTIDYNPFGYNSTSVSQLANSANKTPSHSRKSSREFAHQRQLSSPRLHKKDSPSHNLLVNLSSKNFDPDLFIIKNLKNSNAVQIENFNNNLINLNTKLDNDIKSNLINSFEKILIVNKNFNTIQFNLKFLKSNFNALNAILSQMNDSSLARIQIEDEISKQNNLNNANTDNFHPNNSVNSNLSLQKSASLSTRRNKRDRSSVMFLEKKWSNELTSLFKNVEGSQRLILNSINNNNILNPSNYNNVNNIYNNKHLLTFSKNWLELNNATYKPVKSSYFYLLNDSLLIASNKKKLSNLSINDNTAQNNTDQNNNKNNDNNNNNIGNTINEDQFNSDFDMNNNGKFNFYNSQSLIADQCWPLREIQLIELNPNDDNINSNNKTKTINFKYRSLSYIYQTNDLNQYYRFTSLFKNAKIKLNSITEQESIKQKKINDSIAILSSSSNPISSSSSSSSTNLTLSNSNNGNIINNNNGSSTFNTKFNGSSLILNQNNKNSRRKSAYLQDLSIRIHSRSFSNSNVNFENSEEDLSQANNPTKANTAMSNYEINNELEGIINEIKRIDNLIDELDVNIAHHKFNDSVNLINDLKSSLNNNCEKNLNKLINNNIKNEANNNTGSNGGTTNNNNNLSQSNINSIEEYLILIQVLKLKINERLDQLINDILYEINNQINFSNSFSSNLNSNSIKNLIIQLKNLKLINKAQISLLNAKSSLIAKLIKKIEINGDLIDYINQMTIIRFQNIKLSILLFKDCFPELEYQSLIVNWSIKEIKLHFDLLQRQLFDIKILNDKENDRLYIYETKLQISELKKVGLDVEFLMNDFYILLKKQNQ
ncbi:exocyst subunit EXO84 ASCRUDRAFT_70324 [Ascoidea rubescens DSM 1968]|uniref:Exocyst complex component EXO84 n=1 Tax=Ascoidea rubescens DSM 1968 TaxID=1344418 RepID=A0A1D2VHF6_9ASCO|nr:hypothetical protein ASCRUDRAFT_70324 [Ascoidea rubescens DSM 1968]ODV61101.1 hypothetical protein ASCRUDRAFT_70324 [Ascoidea rubescens DSM 1968]